MTNQPATSVTIDLSATKKVAYLTRIQASLRFNRHARVRPRGAAITALNAIQKVTNHLDGQGLGVAVQAMAGQVPVPGAVDHGQPLASGRRQGGVGAKGPVSEPPAPGETTAAPRQAPALGA